MPLTENSWTLVVFGEDDEAIAHLRFRDTVEARRGIAAYSELLERNEIDFTVYNWNVSLVDSVDFIMR